jgi:hypothetical protein
MRPTLRSFLLASVFFAAGLGVGALGFSGELDSLSKAGVPISSEPAEAAVGDRDVAIMNAEPVSGLSSAEGAGAGDRAQLLARVEDLAQGWGRMQEQFAELQARIAALERQPLQANAISAAGADEDSADADRPRTPR